MNTDIAGKWALVTGASSGLGVEFARQLGQRGCNLILVARRQDRLEKVRDNIKEMYSVRVEVIVMDLATDSAPQNLWDEVNARDTHIDILINNAGYGLFGEFVNIPWENEQNMLKLDIITVTHLTKLFVKDMMKRNYGYILQIASIGAYQPSPTYASYSAAKSYVLNFGEAINYEIRNTGVSCTVLSPGITATGFLKVSGQKPSLYQRLVMMEPEKVAQIGIRAMLQRKSSIVPGFINKITIFSNRLMPRKLSAAIGNYLMKLGQK